jgi:hypothetical protein
MSDHTRECDERQKSFPHHGRSGLETTCKCWCHPKHWEHKTFAEASP